MNILLWYLPYAVFSGACDVVLSDGKAQPGRERPAATAEPKRDTDQPALARAA
jgi:hypothetical protein